ncbi:amidophosphoribosyltransferase [Ichthyobacterium seriolicida]|uniref:Amidophosphoribosyltransferase n=1 Tax=Ichthyobacterium seriolicida TaxID=242600 RepID=A0A1J1E2Y4_9FLAO|nr:amidophosphoribosyltransferase [Ichthyobacterium seriolicida]BAV94388.1 amidophosphoribosyltransferase [Ichthyobacterium seriolicida]
MSDNIKHECGIALARFFKPLSYYREKYQTCFYGIKKMNLLMGKQHNRGQDGAGIAGIKLNVNPGDRYIYRTRSNSESPIKGVFDTVYKEIDKILSKNPDKINDVNWLEANIPSLCHMYLGHIRYGTFGNNDLDSVHPFLRENNWKTRNIVIGGNFNMTNVSELFKTLVEIGQYPKKKSDTVTIMENIGHFLDEENDFIYQKYKGSNTKKEISSIISREMDVERVLKRASKKWDGGYVIAGMFGHGDSFVMRDPNGIRPAYYYRDEEMVVVASERPAIQTAFGLPFEKIEELPRGSAIIIKENNEVYITEIKKPEEHKACSFERIYFSRGNDGEIYKERKSLGKRLLPQTLKSIDSDVGNTIFSYIPNTSEVAFLGMIEGVNDYLNEWKRSEILKLSDLKNTEKIDDILKIKPRVEKIAIKDAKLRSFITQDIGRKEMVAHIYDTTYGVVDNTNNLVVLDDSIVRGTTLRNSIIKILDKLNPKKIIILSSAPQIRYPDCYGIDMAKLEDFVAFRAAVKLLEENGQSSLLKDVYDKCLEQVDLPDCEIINYVKKVYEPFSVDQISSKIAELISYNGIKAKVEVIYQTIDNLHEACPHNRGDWYFTGDYPTPGGNRVVNRSFINFIERKNERAY